MSYDKKANTVEFPEIQIKTTLMHNKNLLGHNCDFQRGSEKSAGPSC